MHDEVSEMPDGKQGGNYILRKEEDMVKVLVLFKRKSGITLEECSRYWYEKHDSA